MQILTVYPYPPHILPWYGYTQTSVQQIYMYLAVEVPSLEVLSGQLGCNIAITNNQ